MILRLAMMMLFAGGGVWMLNAYVQPLFMQIQDTRAEQAVVSDAITDAREVIRLRDELQGRYNSISGEDIQKVREFLPAGSALSEFLITIDAFAGQADIRLEDVMFEEDTNEENAESSGRQTLVLNLSVRGTYADFRDLLTLLEQNLRLIDVVHIELTPEEGETMSFELTLHTYYQDRTIL